MNKKIYLKEEYMTKPKNSGKELLMAKKVLWMNLMDKLRDKISKK